MLRYLIVGGFLFLLDYGTTSLIYIELHHPLELAQWVGRLLGAGLGYVLHHRYTFRSEEQQRQDLQLRYALVAIALWAVSPAVLKATIHILSSSFLAAKVLTECMLVCASYLLLRNYVFRHPSAP